MKTLENNKLIAEFLGYIDNGCSEDGFLIHPVTNYDVDFGFKISRRLESINESSKKN